MTERYQCSERMLEQALQTIPLGSQTFSKSKTQFPWGVSPYFIQKGKGSHVWDVDGHEYIDLINGLASITLGYNDPDVTKAVQEQLKEGVIFSLSHRIEIEVAEKIVEMVPCAEMVRFGKNGSDATAGAIRLARAYTGRDHVAVCGYHGWQDWYIGSTSRNHGVPNSIKKLTHTFFYNDIDSLKNIFKQWPHQVAAVILEPMNIVEPKSHFLEEIKEITAREGALLIFDEMITGFRFALGGAQEYFNIIPDLATFGKGVANGYPLSVVTGRGKYMKLMEEIFYSFTFGGETLSLAASLATMQKLQREPVIETLGVQGEKIIEGIQKRTKQYDIGHILSISGHPSWSFLTFKSVKHYNPIEVKTLFLQELFVRGILMIGTHNMSYAHTDQDIEKLLSVYDEIFPILKDAVDNSRLKEKLRCQSLKPLFFVR